MPLRPVATVSSLSVSLAKASDPVAPGDLRPPGPAGGPGNAKAPLLPKQRR